MAKLKELLVGLFVGHALFFPSRDTFFALDGFVVVDSEILSCGEWVGCDVISFLSDKSPWGILISMCHTCPWYFPVQEPICRNEWMLRWMERCAFHIIR